MTSKFTTDPDRIDWQKTGIFLGICVGVLILAVLMFRCSPEPKPDPNLGKAMQQTTAAKAAETQAVTEKAVPELQERIQAPIQKRAERTRHHVAKIEAAPPIVGAASVPDDDAYRSLCQPGGVYQGHKERGRECRKLKG